MSASEDSRTLINELDEIKFRIGYFLPEDDDNQVVIRLGINDAEFHIYAVQALGIANLILQTVHRADAIRYAVRTHSVLTHNNSEKRKEEFLDAIHSLIARAESSSNGSDVPQ